MASAPAASNESQGNQIRRGHFLSSGCWSVVLKTRRRRVKMGAEQIPAEEICELVDRFYAKVRLDPEIGPIFNATIDDWPAHLSLLKNFWSTVLLMDRSYKGDPLSKHLPLMLDPPHFARWLELFEETAREV